MPLTCFRTHTGLPWLLGRKSDAVVLGSFRDQGRSARQATGPEWLLPVYAAEEQGKLERPRWPGSHTDACRTGPVAVAGEDAFEADDSRQDRTGWLHG